MQQLELFTGLPIPPALPARGSERRHRAAAVAAVQLAFAFRLRELERDDRDTDFDYPVHTVTAASEAAAIETTAPSSIWEMAKAAAATLRRRGRFGDASGFETTKPLKATIEREAGVTRHTGAAYPARWTDEDFERERQRRARQRPPRPTKKAKTKSRKLVEMIGTEDDYGNED